MGQCTDGVVTHNAAMVEDFLELNPSFGVLSSGQMN